MKDLTLFTLGENTYGIWRDEAPTVKVFQTIHWLPPVPRHIAGLSILDGMSVTLFDLSACLGLSPGDRKKASYPALMAEYADKIAGFMVDLTIGHVAIPPADVHPMPEFLQTPIIDTCVIYDLEPIPIINLSKLFKSVLEAEFKPPKAKHCTAGHHPGDVLSVKKVRVFECGGESFAISAACVKKRRFAPGRITKPGLLPDYVSGMTFDDGNLVSLIHLSRRLQLPDRGTAKLMLAAEIGGQTFGFLVDSDKDQWHDNNFEVKPLPALVQNDWMQGAVIHGKEIIPIIEPIGLISSTSNSLSRTPLPQRYTTSSQFMNIFGGEDVKVFEFSLLGARHALPQYEVEDQFNVIPYRRLPNVISIVAGVTEYAGELIPVLDLAACFGRDSMITSDWQMLLVKNGDFRALVLVEAIFGERTLPVKMHRGLPFEEPHLLVYGCYPDETMVRLVLNVEALSVHFDKTLFKNFFTTLSKEIALEPMDMGLEPKLEETGLGEPVEKPEKPAEPEISEASTVPIAPEGSIAIATSLPTAKEKKENEDQGFAAMSSPDIEASVRKPEQKIAQEETSETQEAQKVLETELEVSQTGGSEEVTRAAQPKATEVGGSAQKATEQIEEDSEPAEFAEAERPLEPNVPLPSIALAESEGIEEKKEIKETAEVVPSDIAAADIVEISAIDVKSDFQEAQKIAKAKAKGTHVADSEGPEPEVEPEETGLGEPVEKPEKPAEPEISKTSTVTIASEGCRAIASSLSTAKEKRENENRWSAERSLLDIEASMRKPKEKIVQEETAETPAAQKIVETELEVSQTGGSEAVIQEAEPEAEEVSWPEQETTENVEEDLELVEFAEAERSLEPDEPPASITFTAAEETEGVEEKREIKEVAEKGLHDTEIAVADPEEIFTIQEKTDLQELQKSIEPELDALQDRGSKKIEVQKAPEKPVQEEQVEKIIELTELVEDEEIIELTELVEPEEIIERTDFRGDGELIEAEDEPEPTVNTSNEETILPVSENVNENSETNVYKKPTRKFGGTLFLTILLIGLILATFYSSGMLENSGNRKEKLEVPIVATHPLPKKRVNTSKVPPSEKSPVPLPGPKTFVVEKESTELPAEIAKPKPAPAKPPMTQPHKAVPATTPNFKIVDAKEINPKAPPSEELPKLDTLMAVKQQPSKMASPESAGTEVHNVEKGDTLWKISKRYTGSGFNYQQVAKENKISNPDLIFPEQKLRVSKKYQ